jgi:hypothetical protein
MVMGARLQVGVAEDNARAARAAWELNMEPPEDKPIPAMPKLDEWHGPDLCTIRGLREATPRSSRRRSGGGPPSERGSSSSAGPSETPAAAEFAEFVREGLRLAAGSGASRVLLTTLPLLPGSPGRLHETPLDGGLGAAQCSRSPGGRGLSGRLH